MQFLEFKNQFSKYLVFSVNEIKKFYPNFNKMNLLNWQKKGYIHKLRNKWYSFSDIIVDEKFLFFIANKIYQPSYVSLETALYYYGIIPEAVFTITSVSTLKTQKIENKYACFSFSSIKTNSYFAYKLMKNEKFTFKIAEIEKALLDFLYLRYSIKTLNDIKSLRLNKQILREELNLQKLHEYATVYNSKILLKKVRILNQFLDD